MRVDGDLIVINSIDHSVKVLRLKANGNFEVLCEASGEVCQAWRFEIIGDTGSLVTSLINLR